MLATVLVGPGKPKLVQIQRPSSGTRRSSLSRASQAGAATEENNSPLTPLQAKKEVSAFSPYDTPCQRTYGAMTPMMQLVSSSESMQKLRPAPLSITPGNAQQRIDSAIHLADRKDYGVTPSDSTYTLTSYGSSAIWPTPSRHTTRSRSSSDFLFAVASSKPLSI